MTTDPTLPEHVASFMRARIYSLEALETLLLLENSGRSWTAAELADAIHCSESAIVSAVQELVASKLVAQVGTRSPLEYAYCAQGVAAQSVAELKRLYESQRVDVLQAISSNAILRVRLGAQKAFPGLFRPPGGKKAP